MPHPILEIYRGLPASGKSTQAKYEVENDLGNTIRVNRDSLRTMLHNDKFDVNVTEPLTVSARDNLIRGYMKKNKRVIVDDTNLATSVVKDLGAIAEFFGAEVKVTDFHPGLEECLRRDAIRAANAKEVAVGPDVINGMYKRFFKKNQLPANPLINYNGFVSFDRYVVNPDLPNAIILDIDGTVADHTGVRSPYDYTKVDLDKPRLEVIQAARLYYRAGYRVIFMSGRESSCYDATHAWLTKHLGGMVFELYMRTAGDKRQDRIIKGELFDKYIRNHYAVEVVFDDRDQVVGLWRNELGLNCFQVNYGNF